LLGLFDVLYAFQDYNCLYYFTHFYFNVKLNTIMKHI